MLSKVNAKGRVTIPKPIRDALGIGPNDRARSCGKAKGC
jgi:AbrB family looped-hinge helix DNA binding protein